MSSLPLYFPQNFSLDRALRCAQLVEQAYVQYQQWQAQGRPRRIPMNIDGATAVIYGELGFPAPLARGLFCLSRAVGLLAHAWEQTQQGGRIKGPLPRPWTWTYDGPAARCITVASDEGAPGQGGLREEGP